MLLFMAIVVAALQLMGAAWRRNEVMQWWRMVGEVVGSWRIGERCKLSISSRNSQMRRNAGGAVASLAELAQCSLWVFMLGRTALSRGSATKSAIMKSASASATRRVEL